MTDNYNTFVLTSDGFKNLADLTPKDHVYDANSRLGRVTYKCTYPINDLSQFSLILDSVDEDLYIVKNDVKVDVVGKTMIRRTTPFQTVQEDDWLFHPWIKREQLFYKTSLDLAKTSNNFYDIEHLYLFNNRVLKIAEDLGIPQKAVKEILIREAAEYEEYIPMVYEYIRLNFEIDSEPAEGSIESFKDFKRFVKDNYVFKMNRFVQIDLDFVAFVISTLTCCKINKTSPSSNSFVYELAYRFENDTDKDLIDRLIHFCEVIDIKYEIKHTAKLTFINIFNKPLFDFVLNSLLVDLGCIVNATKDCQEYFIERLFKNTEKVNGCRKIILQIKELFLYHKLVVGTSTAPEGYYAFLMEDDFGALDSNLILVEEGYYSRVISKQPVTDRFTEYTYFETQDKSTSLMTYTRK